MERLIRKPAPPFQMKAVSGDGESFCTVNLEDYKGKWLIIFFYPLDFTFVCPTEITSFSQSYERFKEAGAEILSISTDSVQCHQAWIRNGLGSINFNMASDSTMKVSCDYGVLLEDEGIALRGLFIIDDQQLVRYSVVHDNSIGRNTEEIFRVLKALQTKELCGANWSVGAEVLSVQKTPEIVASVAKELDDIVKIYTLPDCSYCKHVKDYLKQENIAFQEINLQISKEGQAFMDSRGYTALPVTVIGDEEICGLQMAKIKELLK